MNSQINKIMELLKAGDWICTSQMYALYMSDPRRRLCDLREKGYILESKKCSLHDFHRGGSKMWRFIQLPNDPPTLPISQNLPISRGFAPGNDKRAIPAPLFQFHSYNFKH